MSEFASAKRDFITLKNEAYEQLKQKSKPQKSESVSGFFHSAYYSLRFILTEKENILFAFLQWAAIGFGYYLWVQVLSWMPDEVWEKAESGDNNIVADIVLLVWSFVCVGLVAYPLGVFSACMGASFILRFQGRQSTIAECLKLVLHRSWTLWIFSWLDGWWTVNRILERLPKKNDKTAAVQKALNEGIYQAWKLASLGFVPAILSGRSVKDACKDSLLLMTNRFGKLAKLRVAYSLICWVVGIGCYVGVFAFLPFINLQMSSDNDIYSFYFFAGFPMLLALTLIMLIFRPLYIISACRLYSCYARETGIKVTLPKTLSKGISALVAFVVLTVLTAVAFLYREPLGINALLERGV